MVESRLSPAVFSRSTFMRFTEHLFLDGLTVFCAAAMLTAGTFPALAQQQPQKPADDDVLRVKTELVQTAVTVVDKDGRFVNGLGRDQFELVVDGKPRPISFFEQVTSGS